MLERLGFPRVGEHRRFVSAIVADTIGSGLFLPVTILYFLKVTDLKLVQIGAALSLSALLTLPAAFVIGSLVDRLGGRADDAHRQRRPGPGDARLPLGAGVLVGGPVHRPAQPRSPGVLGLLRQRRHRDHPAR